jgi:hypothetical protein
MLLQRYNVLHTYEEKSRILTKIIKTIIVHKDLDNPKINSAWEVTTYAENPIA